MAAAADEGAVGVGQVGQRRRRLADHDLDRHPVGGGVGPDALGVALVALDGQRRAGRRQAGALDGDAAAAGAHVPEHAVLRQVELAQGDGAHLGPGDHAGAVGEALLGQAPRQRRAASPGRAATAPRPTADPTWPAARPARSVRVTMLVGGGQVAAHGHVALVAAGLEQRPGQRLGRVLGRDQHRHLGLGPHEGDRRREVGAVGRRRRRRRPTAGRGGRRPAPPTTGPGAPTGAAGPKRSARARTMPKNPGSPEARMQTRRPAPTRSSSTSRSESRAPSNGRRSASGLPDGVEVAAGADQHLGVDQRGLGVGAVGHAAEQADHGDGPPVRCRSAPTGQGPSSSAPPAQAGTARRYRRDGRRSAARRRWRRTARPGRGRRRGAGAGTWPAAWARRGPRGRRRTGTTSRRASPAGVTCE